MTRTRFAPFVALALAAGTMFLTAADAHAAGGKKPSSAALRATPQSSLTGLQPGDQVSFNVDEPARMSLWVSNRCYQDGVVVVAENIAVVDNVAGPFTLAWESGHADCWTYTWAFPEAAKPLAGTEFWYSVG